MENGTVTAYRLPLFWCLFLPQAKCRQPADAVTARTQEAAAWLRTQTECIWGHADAPAQLFVQPLHLPSPVCKWLGVDEDAKTKHLSK